MSPPRDIHQRFPLTWARDIRADTATRDFVEGWLLDGALSVAYGEANCGKTFFAADLGMHVALGRSWNGRDVAQGTVIYLALEGGHGIKNRVAAFTQGHGIEGRDFPFAIIPTGLDLLNPAADTRPLIDLFKAIAERTDLPVRLIIIDTLSRALAGGEENSSQDMGALVTNADLIRHETGAHVLFVHHSGKDATRGARGHSLLRAASDTEIEITRDHAAGISTATITKQRDRDRTSSTNIAFFIYRHYCFWWRVCLKNRHNYLAERAASAVKRNKKWLSY